MIEDLLNALKSYKTTMEYNNLDFNADKTKRYEAVRIALAKIYDGEERPFGPITMSNMAENLIQENREDAVSEIEEQKKHIKKGYSRVMEKIKEIRQSFSHAVTQGRRSGSGKIVMEHYDILVEISGGSPSTEPLPFGARTDSPSTSAGIFTFLSHFMF